MFKIILSMFNINVQRQRARNHSGNSKVFLKQEQKTKELCILIKYKGQTYFVIIIDLRIW